MVVQTQTEETAPAAPDEPRADLLRPQRLLPAAVPEQVPEPHRHPGLPQGERRGQLAGVDADLQAHDPVPVRARARLPGPVRGALPARRGGRGDRDPRLPPLRRRPGHQGRCSTTASTRPCRSRSSRKTGRRVAVIGSGPAGHGGRLLPADLRPRRDGLRARPGARRHAPLRHPAVPPAQGRGPRGRVRVGHAARRQVRGATRRSGATSRSTTSRTRATTRSCVAIGCYDTNKLGIPGEDADGRPRRPRVPADRDPRPAYPGHEGSRVVVIGGGFTSMDCTRTSVRQGAAEVTLVYRRDMKDMPAANEVHEAIEEGATAIFQAGADARRHRRRRQPRHRRRVHPDAPRRARRVRPAPARSPRPARSSRSPATGCC